jgi:protein phosphatase 1G
MSDTYLKKCITEAVSEEGGSEKFWFSVSSVQGWSSTQEDAHLALLGFEENASLFGVFDGHNGAEVAKFVAKKLPKIIIQNKNYRKGKIGLGLQESFMTLDKSLLTRESEEELKRLRQEYSKEPINKENEPAIKSGCTAAVVLIKDNVLYVANLGDTRCILSRNNNALRLTSDHKPSDQTEKKRIERANGRVFCGRINNRINVSRAFGDHSYKLNTSLPQKEQIIIAWPDVVVEELKPNEDEFMVLVSDGVSSCISIAELISFVAERIKTTYKLSEICEQLFTRILPEVMPAEGAAGKDNMTFMIVKFERINQKTIGSKETISIASDPSSVIQSSRNQCPKENSPHNQN